MFIHKLYQMRSVLDVNNMSRNNEGTVTTNRWELSMEQRGSKEQSQSIYTYMKIIRDLSREQVLAKEQKEQG